ncbi:MAG: DUF975 family protein [Christensenellales bacterium]|jgi:uncharacterized membrane protein
MRLRQEIKQQARTNFMNQYGISVGACVLFMVIASVTTSFGLGIIFIMPPLMVGYAFYNLRIYRGQQGDIGEMFSVGFGDYWRNIGGILWMELFIFLWSLLFIIPGIVKALSYFMTPYILAESKSVSATDALLLSMRMTKGYKGEIFVMALSFIGWGILSALTMGILAILYTGPYTSASFAGLYEELKQNAIDKGIITAEELA